ncbi:hypothetical protein MVES1_003442 [Malassezia vespertilionis]|nr:uncharacterized protein MVES1_003442 [Malassezia vespertilionis]WFD08073.1 hypothetical protein MVES1_003442 [Malassezia vespertilionis]
MAFLMHTTVTALVHGNPLSVASRGALDALQDTPSATPLQQEELQCRALLYLLAHPRLSLARITELWYPDGAFDPSLHLVLTDASPAVRRLQRAALYRFFTALLHANCWLGAATILHDARLRPSQPKHLLGALLGAMPASESDRAALATACNALVLRTHGRMSAPIYTAMLERLAALHMHREIDVWVSFISIASLDGQLRRALLANIVHNLTAQGAHSAACTLVCALPAAACSPRIYTALLGQYADAWLDEQGRAIGNSRAAALWQALRRHGAPRPTAYLARLASHARHARSMHAIRDLRIMHNTLRLPVHDPIWSRALLYTTRAILRSGRTSLGLRYVRRYLRTHALPQPAASALLNVFIAHLLDGVPQSALSHPSCIAALAKLYRGVVFAGSGAHAQPWQAPLLPVRNIQAMQPAMLLMLVHHIVHLAAACRASADNTTILLLVRAAAQWDQRVGTRALWHMASLALPDSDPAEHAASRAARSALLRALAGAFVRRRDWHSVRRAVALARSFRAPHPSLPT